MTGATGAAKAVKKHCANNLIVPHVWRIALADEKRHPSGIACCQRAYAIAVPTVYAYMPCLSQILFQKVCLR